MGVSRRVFLGSAAAGLVIPAIRLAAFQAASEAGTAPSVFAHGVASGDPLADRVVLWTRVTLGRDRVEVAWIVATDPAARRIVARGTTETGPWRDHTVKVDASGLEPGRTYYYQFEAGGERSPIGRTRTLPVGHVERVRLAFASCANLPAGYFNAYRGIARRDDLAAVLHLGDYLYEFENRRYGDGTRTGRIPEPDREIVSLADYRTRHAQYKRDPDLQAAHRRHPFIVVWDDHEFANDTWAGGAGNHSPETEGDWYTRKAAALQAYFEWMPIREIVHSSRQVQIYRSFGFGDLVDLIMLDTRVAGRDEQVPRENVAGFFDPGRTLLGEPQEAWLAEELRGSKRAGTRWRLLGQQILVGQRRRPDGSVGSPDTWDGYTAARARMFDVLERDRIDNLVVLTGDAHASWAMEMTRDPWSTAGYDRATGRGAFGVEFVGPAISSPGPYKNEEEAAERTRTVLEMHPHVRFHEGLHRGYVIVDITPDRVQGDYWFVPSVDVRTDEEWRAAALVVQAGTTRLVPVEIPGGSPGSVALGL